jgi:hypothetical protein
MEQYNKMTIDVNEYRLGIIVMDVAPYDKIYKLDTGMLINAVNGVSYRPIPLTPEWLERCGLKADPKEPDDYQQWSNLHMTIAQYNDGLYLYSTATDPYHSQAVGKKIEYVHQLQNISLDLYGEELNIEL